ncbi:MAG: helix-turn-helix domain-containing protein [Fimbriimonas sp.]
MESYKLYTVRQAADLVGVSESAVRDAIRSGDLNTSRLKEGRGSVYVTGNQIAKWVELMESRGARSA